MKDDEFKTTVIKDLTYIKTSLPHKASLEDLGKVKGLTQINKSKIGGHQKILTVLAVTYIPLILGIIYTLSARGGN